MRLASIWAVALAETRSARRQVRTWVFAILAVGVSFLQFVESGVSHAGAGWISPSVTLPAPRFLMSQVGVFLIGIFLVGVIFLAFDVRARDRRERMVEVLDTRPVSNVELLAGRLLGVVGAVLVPALLLVVLVQAFGMIGGMLGAPTEPVQTVSIATFLLVDALPLFVAWAALVVLLAVVLRNRLLVAVVALGLFAAWVWWTSTTPLYLSHLVGTTALAGLVSDLLPRFAEPETLAHRFLLLALAAGVLVAAAALHPRPDSRSRYAGLATALVLVVVGASGMAGLYVQATDRVAEREHWLAAHEAASSQVRADVEHVGGRVRIDPGRALELDIVMRVVPPAGGVGDGLLFSLNPGLVVEEARLDGEPTAVVQRDGLLTIAASPRSTFELALRATGVPDPDFAYLDSVHDFATGSTGNRNSSDYLGREASIFEAEYVALMPGVRWLPTPGANLGIDDPGAVGRDFFTLDLSVEVPSGWLIAGPGRRRSEGEGRYRFNPSAPVPAVALLASAFERRSIEVADVELEVLVSPGHMGNMALFEDAQTPLREHLEELFDDALVLGIGYPYGALSMVETPATLRVVGGGWRMDAVQGLPGVMLMDERGFPTARFDLAFQRAANVQDVAGGIEAFKIKVLRRFFAGDFRGGNPYAGMARNLMHHQSSVVPDGMSATALEYVVEELVVRLLTGNDGFFSAHLFTRDGSTSRGRLTQSVADAFDFGTGPSNALDAVANRPLVWDLALHTSLAALDPSVGPARVLDVLGLKGGAVARSILDALGRERTGALLSELRQRHLGGHYDLASFYETAHDVGAELEPLLGDWLNDSALPGFLASHAKMARLPDTSEGNPRYQTRVHIRNDEPAPGLLRLRYVTGKRAKMRGRGPMLSEPVRVPGNSSVEVALVTASPVAQLWMAPYLSLNRRDVQIVIDKTRPSESDPSPARKRERPGSGAGGDRGLGFGNGESGHLLFDRGMQQARQKTPPGQVGAFHGVRASDWLPAIEEGIIVDDLDAGFWVDRDVKTNGLRIGAWSLPVELGGEMDLGIPSFVSSSAVNGGQPVHDGEWRRQDLPSSWGRYRHTIARASADDGHARAVFAVEVPSAGEWRLEYHMPFVPRQGKLNRVRSRLAATKTFGSLGEYDIVLQFGVGERRTVDFDAAASSEGWNDLGRYELPKGPVRLVVSNRTTGDVVLADAIRLRPVGRPAINTE